MWDCVTSVQLGNPILGHTDYILALDVSNDGKTIISGSKDTTIKYWTL